MSENGITTRDNGVFEVTGQLTFQSVPQFLAQTDKWLHGGTGKVTIDMHGVTLADSAGLALLIEWLQLSRSAQREIVFTNMPDQMRDLIHVNGLTQVFGLTLDRIAGDEVISKIQNASTATSGQGAPGISSINTENLKSLPESWRSSLLIRGSIIYLSYSRVGDLHHRAA